MVKKTAQEERTDKLEKDVESLTLEVRTHFAEQRQYNEELLNQMRQLRRRQKTKRRPREGSGGSEETVVDDGGGEETTTETESTTSEDSFVPRHRYKGRRLEIPVFEGGDAYGWLVKVERYFKTNGVAEDEMLEAVAIALDGRALNWYQWWEEQNHEPSCEEFKQAVIRRFQPSLVRNPLGPILNVRQTGTVMEYREQFELLMAPLKRNERGMLESIFVNGLSEEIQAELKLHSTRGLNALMDRALSIEERNNAMKERETGKTKNDGAKWKTGVSGSGWDSGRNRVFMTKPRFEPSSNNNGPIATKRAHEQGEQKQSTGKRLSQEELRDLSRRGLCFKCGERWGHDHVCKR